LITSYTRLYEEIIEDTGYRASVQDPAEQKI
jgi:hypothetical protein